MSDVKITPKEQLKQDTQLTKQITDSFKKASALIAHAASLADERGIIDYNDPYPHSPCFVDEPEFSDEYDELNDLIRAARLDLFSSMGACGWNTSSMGC